MVLKLTGDLIHPFEPTIAFFNEKGNQYSCLTLYDIKSYFKKNHQKFIRFSKLLDLENPRNTKETRFFGSIEMTPYITLKPDFIIRAEDCLVFLFIRFINPLHKTQQEQLSFMPVSDIRLFIAYRARLCDKIRQSGKIIVSILTNEMIHYEYLQLLRQSEVCPIAITTNYLNACLRTIRLNIALNQRQKQRLLQNSL